MSIFDYPGFKNQIKSDNVNVLITSANYDDRCLTLPEIIRGAGIREAFVFQEQGCNHSIKNANTISSQPDYKVSLVEYSVDQPIEIVGKVNNIINELFRRYLQLNVLVDITGFTTENLLILMKRIYEARAGFDSVYVGYVGAKDYSLNQNQKEKWLQKGVADIRKIEGYQVAEKSDKTHLLLLMGFEYDMAVKTIKQGDYDFVSVGFGVTPIQANHFSINYERYKRLVNEIPETKEFRFSLTNPLETKKQILEYLDQEEFNGVNTTIAPMNNKLSTIGACLASLNNESIQQVYCQPEVCNKQGYSEANDDVYLFKLSD